MSPSRTGDAIVEKAKECYSLGLIDVKTLERVIRRADSPGYCPILDLPLTHEIEEARRLERKAKRTQRTQRRRWWFL